MSPSRAALTGAIRVLFIAILTSSLARADLQPRELFGIRAEAATIIVQGIESGSLPFAALAASGVAENVETEDGSPRLRVPIVFEVPAVGELQAASTVEFYAYAMTPTGEVAAHFSLAVDFEAERHPGLTGVKLVATLDLPPATYSMRFLVLEPKSHQFGLRLSSVTLPGADGPAALTRPTIVDRCSGWEWVVAPGAQRLTAAAIPVLLTGSRVELSSSLLGAPSDLEPLGATVHLNPIRAEDSESHRIDAEPLGTETVGERVVLAIELPAVARGVYELSVRLESDSGALTSPSTDVWVVGTTDVGPTLSNPCSRTWTAVVAQSSGEAGPTPGSLPVGADATATQPARERQRTRLRRAYGEILRQLAATSDIGAASEALCDVEKDLSNVQFGLQALFRNELDVAKRLATQEPEVLPSLMMLHHDSYLEHLRREQFALAGHSGRAVQALGELMVDRRLPEESLALAAGILTSLAEHGHRSRMLVPSQLLLQEALEMDPGNPDALFLLSVSYEWLGRYEEAGKLLQRVVETAATNSEARLRLGIMLRRTGEAAGAEREFNRILREGASPWLLSLTYQALAGLLWELERYDEAVELLRAGRSRLGADQRLYVLSAHALDRAGRPAEARRLLSAMPVGGSARTPRFRYGESLTSPLLSLRESVDRGVAVRLPLLARAFEETPSK